MDLSILTLLKTLRLARLARLIRALRYPIFRTFGLSWIQSNSLGGGFKDGFISSPTRRSPSDQNGAFFTWPYKWVTGVMPLTVNVQSEPPQLVGVPVCTWGNGQKIVVFFNKTCGW